MKKSKVSETQLRKTTMRGFKEIHTRFLRLEQKLDDGFSQTKKHLDRILATLTEHNIN